MNYPCMVMASIGGLAAGTFTASGWDAGVISGIIVACTAIIIQVIESKW